MRYAGSDLQGRFMARVRGVDPQRCLAVPIDVGKCSAVALVADHHCEVVVAPFEFGLDEPGVGRLVKGIAAAETDRDAEVCRAGVESAGHYRPQPPMRDHAAAAQAAWVAHRRRKVAAHVALSSQVQCFEEGPPSGLPSTNVSDGLRPSAAASAPRTRDLRPQPRLLVASHLIRRCRRRGDRDWR